MKNAIFFLLLALVANLFYAHSASGQGDTLYFTNEGEQMVEEAAATYKNERKRVGQNQWTVTRFRKNEGKWEWSHNSDIDQLNDSTYVENHRFIANGPGYKKRFTIYPVAGGYRIRQNGKIITKGFSLSFFPFREHGTWTDYDSLTGRKLEEKEYESGYYTERNRYFLESGEVLENVYTFPEIDPRFRYRELDFEQFLGENLVYPKDAIDANVEGKVFVTFVITTDGTVKDVRLLKGIFKSCDEESQRVVAATSGKWVPGVQNGKNVNVRMNVPIVYKLTRNGK